MGTERIDTKSLLAENRKTCDWVTSRGLTFSMSGDDAREILDALAQELSDAAVLRERIRLLERWSKRAEETLVYAATILGPFADKEGGPAKIAMDECESRFVEYAQMPDSPAAASEE